MDGSRQLLEGDTDGQKLALVHRISRHLQPWLLLHFDRNFFTNFCAEQFRLPKPQYHISSPTLVCICTKDFMMCWINNRREIIESRLVSE